MKNFSQNNLREASSPYLRQHQENPVWWQPWDEETLAHVKKTERPLLVSVGYATCHWCHVMAKEAFSDPVVADYLNQHFVAIKVDREERPDIDHYLMSFLTASTGQGGWPLNAFLTPDLRPIYALTYAPVQPGYGVPDFPQVLKKVKEFYDKNRDKINDFDTQDLTFVSGSNGPLESKLIEGFDPEYGGYGQAHKFPPFSTLLCMLSYGDAIHHHKLLKIAALTLDQMMQKGLHDHLQGGFFRYCVDRAWTIPHFEKMLYDQAMALWTYSLAFRVLKKPSYQKVAEKIVRCLEETFSEKNLYCAAHDADTEHEEGATYLWEKHELQALLTPEAYARFCAVYHVTAKGNFEGKNHLLKKNDGFEPLIEDQLLLERKKRKQPARDTKRITSWNCLVAVALVQASRFLSRSDYFKKAEQIAQTLLKEHFRDGRLAHSSCEGKIQKEEFLQDVSALFLLLTYLFEEKGIYQEELELFYQKTCSFKKNGKWVENHPKDFREIEASSLDHPLPSSISLAEAAITRAKILKGEPVSPENFKEPHVNDFYNFSILLQNGFFHQITSPQKLPWGKVPLLSIQIKGSPFQDCYQGTCRQLV